MFRQSAQFLLICAFLLQRCIADQQCYYPEGTSATDVPCKIDGSASACCNAEAFCMGNGLCFLGGTISRGSCTDQTWRDPACPQYCTDVNPSIGATVVNCNQFTNQYSCTNCSDSSSIFLMNDADTFLFNTSDNSQILLTARSTLNLTTSATNQTSNGTIGSTSQGEAYGSTASPSSTGPKYSAGAMAGVGLGIGIPLLLAQLAALVVIQQQRKRLNALGASHSAGAGQMKGSQLHVPQGYDKPGSAESALQLGYSQGHTPPMRSLNNDNVPGYYDVPFKGRLEMSEETGIVELGDERTRLELDGMESENSRV